MIPLLRHFTILGQKNAQNMLRYYTVEQGKNTDGKKITGITGPKLSGKTSGIINPLFAG